MATDYATFPQTRPGRGRSQPNRPKKVFPRVDQVDFLTLTVLVAASAMNDTHAARVKRIAARSEACTKGGRRRQRGSVRNPWGMREISYLNTWVDLFIDSMLGVIQNRPGRAPQGPQ